MSLECVQVLSTFISREYTFIKLFEAAIDDREAILEVLVAMNIPQKAGSASPSLRSGPSVDSLSSHEPARTTTPERSSPKEDDAPEDAATSKIVEMRKLVCSMEELIGILKSG
jgi:hypothetical protein